MEKYCFIFLKKDDGIQIESRYKYEDFSEEETELLISRLKEEIRTLKNRNEKYDYSLVFKNNDWQQVKGKNNE